MPQLDGVRAFAVAAVIYSHWIPSKYHFGLPLGSGVELFFVLSGFLITGILLRCRDYPNKAFAVRAFYVRRFLRIVPLFYAVLLVACVFNVPEVRETLPWHICYLSNFFFLWNQDWHGPVSHLWSLAVEEQFYLFWPAVMLGVPDRMLRFSVVTLIAVGVLSRCLLPILLPDVDLLATLPNMNFDALGLGALLAIRSHEKSRQFRGNLLRFGLPVWVLLYGIRMTGYTFPLHRVCEHSALILSFASLVSRGAAGMEGSVKQLLEVPIVLYLGRISYGLYIIHPFAPLPVRFITEELGYPEHRFGLIGLSLMLLFTLGCASLSWWLFEAPINSLKRYFPYRKAT